MQVQEVQEVQVGRLEGDPQWTTSPARLRRTSVLVLMTCNMISCEKLARDVKPHLHVFYVCSARTTSLVENLALPGFGVHTCVCSDPRWTLHVRRRRRQLLERRCQKFRPKARKPLRSRSESQQLRGARVKLRCETSLRALPQLNPENRREASSRTGRIKAQKAGGRRSHRTFQRAPRCSLPLVRRKAPHQRRHH